MVGTFRIVLKQEEGFDIHDTREFDLALDSKFAIGRASKNQAKGYLLPGKHNVFIDSPVVSREHAVFTANTSSGSPQVFITDTKSMHGTYVNGTQLEPNHPKQLSNGDGLQFGVNVNRNESYFMAYKYTFKAELSDPEPFSRGFTVPEAESEEEELEFIPSSRGTQLNPLVLEDSDAEPEPELDENSEDAEQFQDNADVTMAHLEDEEIVNISDSEDDAADSVADDMSSDVESDDASTGSALEYDLESPMAPAAQVVEDVQVLVEVPAAQFEPAQHGHPALAQPDFPILPETDRGRIDYLLSEYEPPVLGAHSYLEDPQVANPWLAQAATTTSFEDTAAPPLPPRPSQKRQRIWDEEDVPIWYGQSSATSEQSALLDSDFFDGETKLSSTSLPTADRMQTPPHIGDAAASCAPSTLESDVAVHEMIDVQPPTPTSVNSRKRSADAAFEEEVENPVSEAGSQVEVEGIAPAQAITNIDDNRDAVITTVEETTIASPRPIAQPKSIFRKALRAAKVMVPATALGAVFTVTALTTLPESFFTVA